MTTESPAKPLGARGRGNLTGVSVQFVEWMREHGEADLWERFQETQKRYRAERPAKTRENYNDRTLEELQKLNTKYTDRLARIRAALAEKQSS